MTNSTEPATRNVKFDRRIGRTKKALRAALMELTEEKGYEAVSVEEITQRANLGRATFYLHYKDKEDLLLEDFAEIAQEPVKVLSEISLAEWQAAERAADSTGEKQPIMPLLKIFEHAAEHAALYGVLLRGGSMPRLQQRIHGLIAQSISEIAQARRRSLPPRAEPQVPLDLLAAYFSGALLSSLTWWLDSPAPIPAVEMAALFQRLFFLGVADAVAPTPAKSSQAPARPSRGARRPRRKPGRP